VRWLGMLTRRGAGTPPAKFFWLAPLLLVAAVAAACMERTAAVQPSASPLELSPEIKVAAVWPYSSRPTYFWEGIQLAQEEINALGGVLGRRVRVIRADDLSSVTEGMAVAQSLAEDRTLLAVIGHRSSFVALPASEVYARAGLIYIAPSATTPALTQRGYSRVFRTIPNDAAIGRQMAQYVAETGHLRVAIAYTDEAYGRGLAAAFEDEAEERGVRVVDRVAHFGDLADIRRTLAKWQAFRYDAIFVAAASPHMAEIVRLLRLAGATVPIYGGDSFDSQQLLDIAGPHAEGVVFASVFDVENNDPETQRFVSAFRARYGYTPDTWAAQAYDALRLLADAIDRAGTVDREAVSAALRDTTRWRGVTGWHTFDASGEVIDKPIVFKTVRNGRFALLSGRRG